MSRRGSSASRALGVAIRTARTARGFTQEGFAPRAGIDRSYFGAIERGEFNITIDTLRTIAAGLDVPAWKLLQSSEAPGPGGE